MLRTVVHGKRRDIGLGGLSVVSLAEAREAAAKLRGVARDGGDPLADRRVARRVMPTFKAAAESVHESRRASWANPKHAAQWINTLTEYAYPTFGMKPVDKVESGDIVKALTPIWLEKPETAKRVLQRVRTVLDWATASGLRQGVNPASGVAQVLPKRRVVVAHHQALPYAHVRGFLVKLAKLNAEPATRLAFEFLILTAARTSEALNAQWSEVSFKEKIWTIPATRMKAHREHRVPLSSRCLEILKQAKALAGDPYVFPGRDLKKPLSNMAFLMILRRMNVDCTAHGFRSSFRDWAAEQTNFPSAVCEAALAHTVRDKTEAAYNRTDLFEKRRDLMSAWQVFCSGGKSK